MKSVSSKSKKSKKIPIKFDKDSFFLFFGIGIVMVPLGALLMYATLILSENETLISQLSNIENVLPEGFKGWIALILGGLFVLFGLFLLLMSLQIFLKFMKQKMKL
ncbi:MAG TPA: hypothetical protein PK559_01625 [Ignavibacteriaceae bacterium]|nr:hypothetical protein [Ignavibacteriaceae bacterium]